MIKKLSKYNAAFDYVDNISIALFARSRRISIISFTTVYGTPAEIASTSSSFVFFLISEIIKIKVIKRIIKIILLYLKKN